MKDAVSMNVKGLKCDNPDCDFMDMTIEFNDYKEWIDKPCPLCGSNLLTKKDYYIVKTLYEVSRIMNKVTPKIEDDAETVTVECNLNGSGDIDFKLKEKE